MTESLDRTMNDTRFEELLGADPLSQDSDFLAATRATPEREAAWNLARNAELRLRGSLAAAAPSPDLLTKLMALPDVDGASEVADLSREAANNDWFRRFIPAAAMLVLALGMSWYLNLDAVLDPEIEQDLFSHIHAEEPFMNARRVQIDELNRHLEASLGAHLDSNAFTESLEVTFVKDCRVAKRVGTHLVVKGKEGPVNVIVLSDALVDSTTPIGDDKLSGRIARSGGTHTLVVIGDRQEPIDEYLRVLDSNLRWEY